MCIILENTIPAPKKIRRHNVRQLVDAITFIVQEVDAPYIRRLTRRLRVHIPELAALHARLRREDAIILASSNNSDDIYHELD